MYSFEGQFRRVPVQNLGGANTSKKDEILRKAREDRKRREENRRTLNSIQRVQACVRGFLVRRQLKTMLRKTFDRMISKEQNVLVCLTNQLVYFYNPTEDEERLMNLCSILKSNPSTVTMHLGSSENNSFLWNFRKVIYFVFEMMSTTINHRRQYFELFSFFISYNLYCPITKRQAAYCLMEIYRYMVSKGYYDKLCHLITTVKSQDVNTESDLTISEIVKLFGYPMEIVNANLDKEFNKKAVKSLINVFIIVEFHEISRTIIIPYLQNLPFFPYEEITKQAVSYDFKGNSSFPQFMSFIYGILHLRKQPFTRKHTASRLDIFWDYLNMLVYITEQIYNANLPSRISASFNADVCNMAKRVKLASMPNHEFEYNNMENDDVNEEDSSEDDEEQSKYNYNSDSDSESNNEKCWKSEHRFDNTTAKALEDNMKYLGCKDVVEEIINVLEEMPDEIPLGITILIAQFMYYHIHIRKACTQYRLVYSLAFCDRFMSWLWSTILTMKVDDEFTYIDSFKHGISLAIHEIKKFSSVVTCYCWLLLYRLGAVEDLDTRDCREALHKSFDNKELLEVSMVMKDLCVNLALPEVRFVEKRLRLDYDPSYYTRMLTALVKLLKYLYKYNTVKNFSTEENWVCNRKIQPKYLDWINDRSWDRISATSHMFLWDIGEEGLFPPRDVRGRILAKRLPFLVSFKERAKAMQDYLTDDQDELENSIYHPGDHPHILVRRDYLYEDAFSKFSTENVPNLRNLIRVQLKSVAGTEEAGIDGGGVFREFISELLKTCFDPQRGLFTFNSNNQLYPNPFVKTILDDYKDHYFFVGRVLAKAMYEGILVELPLTNFFLSKICYKSTNFCIHHLESLDPVLYKNLISLKYYDKDVSDLGLDFTIVTEQFGEAKVIELKPGGANIPVTKDNRMEYIRLTAEYRINYQIEDQCTAFREGMADVMSMHLLKIFNTRELQTIISGVEMPIDIKDLQQNTHYSGGYDANHPTILLFWRLMEEFDDDHRRQLLKFATSCSRPPLFGFRVLEPPFCIQKVRIVDRLPTSSTCMNLLKMPEYEDYETLKEKVLYAIQSGSGFELS